MKPETIQRTYNLLFEVWELAHVEAKFDFVNLAKKHHTSAGRLRHAIRLGYFQESHGHVFNTLTSPPTMEQARLVCEAEARAARESLERCVRRRAMDSKFSFTPKPKPTAAPVQLKLQPQPLAAYVAIPATALDTLVRHWLSVCTFEWLKAASAALTERAMHGLIEHPTDNKLTHYF